MFIIGFKICLFSGPLDLSASAALERGLEMIFEDDIEDCGVLARFWSFKKKIFSLFLEFLDVEISILLLLTLFSLFPLL